MPKLDVTYLDHNASSPLLEELLAELPGLAQYGRGNASSLHQYGRQSRRLVSEATAGIAHLLHCKDDQIYWTSGASEANTWALSSAAQRARTESSPRGPARFLVSAVEHDSTWLTARGLGETHTLRVLPSGVVDLIQLKQLLESSRFDLLSVVHASNETGVIQPLGAIAHLCATTNTPLHVDCAQTLGKLPLNFSEIGASYATFSAH
ncbi:MAG: aminotransferase class V-fold PLP-dependent enzyme, partial [Deltaproteobacteria bacterium]|nr:aminotransferase class V-fold PLP-dependent enzyme [Deltaproteobacteria bacterium]